MVPQHALSLYSLAWILAVRTLYPSQRTRSITSYQLTTGYKKQIEKQSIGLVI